ncbi:hypothetical protein C2E21_3917 [Chlorella sorokiniana]|uniref:Uncharacterized protein n=1 Tax=Chlorella sorokiniana TaxID=3076 RepID=A0A2P6TTD4_CHLSO|nr:hypothetical protein C2E21_3917 [Chlorella sorokiniana]|eukprot:PRW57329.1 hypothetical protein C2E21_3917 [Chlorella sorokiniana]
MAKAAQEFAGLQPMIARFFGSPSPSKAAGAAGSAVKQVLAADAAARVQAPLPTAGTALFQAAASSPKAASPSLFVMPKPQPSFTPGTMTMRMQHSSPQK